MVLLEVKQLTRRMSKEWQIADVSFNVRQGEKVAIAGASGAGKTTLLKMIAGHVQPHSGSVFFSGEKVKGPEEQLLPGHKGIAYLSQHYEMPNNYRVEELVWFDNKMDEAEATKLFQLCRIYHLLKRSTNQLSGGEKQRIALCRLLIQQPRLLLMDEPFSNLDPVHTRTLKQVLDSLSEQLQLTCILTSHEPEDTLPWADNIVVMQEGRIIQQGTPRNIYLHPRSEYVAGLFGSYQLMAPADMPLLVPGFNEALSEGNHILLRPEQIVTTRETDGVKATVRKIKFKGSWCEVTLQAAHLELTMQTSNMHTLKIGEQLLIKIAATEWWAVNKEQHE